MTNEELRIMYNDLRVMVEQANGGEFPALSRKLMDCVDWIRNLLELTEE